MHPIDQLFLAMQEVEPYPTGMVPPPCRIDGTAFFPGGTGLWNSSPGRPLPPPPTRGVMVLGQDFDSERGFETSLRRGTEVTVTLGVAKSANSTWKSLLSLLAAAAIPPEECFFTNSYMGLRVGKKATGPSPAARDAAFAERCRTFFVQQVKILEPAIVLALGLEVTSFLAPLAAALSGWRRARTFSQLDEAGPLVREATFPGTPFCTVVALTHPSYRALNAKFRRYSDQVGHQAELLMLRHAKDLAWR